MGNRDGVMNVSRKWRWHGLINEINWWRKQHWEALSKVLALSLVVRNGQHNTRLPMSHHLVLSYECRIKVMNLDFFSFLSSPLLHGSVILSCSSSPRPHQTSISSCRTRNLHSIKTHCSGLWNVRARRSWFGRLGRGRVSGLWGSTCARRCRGWVYYLSLKRMRMCCPMIWRGSGLSLLLLGR